MKALQHRLGIAILAVPWGRSSGESDTVGCAVDALIEAGHRLIACVSCARAEADIRAQLVTWVSDREIDAVIVIGAAGDDTTHRALAPLITESLRVGQGAAWHTLLPAQAVLRPISASRCGSKNVYIVSELAARAMPPPIPSKLRQADARATATTGSIATIGDLPSVIDLSDAIDLRASGKRGLWMVGGIAVAVAGIFLVAAIDVVKRNQALAAPHHADPELAASSQAAIADPASSPADAHVSQATLPTPQHPAPVKPDKGRANGTKGPVVVPSRLVRIPKPNAPALATAVATTADPLDEDCNQSTCAAHGNQRECCAPYREQAPQLDRPMVATAIAAVKPQALQCNSELQAEGTVKISVRVDADGHVANAMVLESPEVSIGKCISDAIRSTEFPPTGAGGSFIYRIELSQLGR